VKKLEIKEPSSICYQFMAFPLMVMECNSKSYEWIYGNFIQTCFDTAYHKAPVPFYFYIFDYTISPFLEVHKINRDFLNFNKIKILDLVKNSINNNYYIYLNLDEFYVPQRFSYKVKHFSHDCLIHGYDLEKKEIYLFGYSSKWQIESTSISFDEFELAYMNLELIDTELTYINLYRCKESGQYALKLDMIVKQLIEYLEGINSSEQFSMLKEPFERAYGMNFYQYIGEYLLNCETYNIEYDIRVFHFLFEHKKIMENRIRYLLETSRIKDEALLNDWEGIAEDALVIKNKVMKLQVLRKYDYQDLNNRIQILGKNERKVLIETIYHLESLID